MKFVCVFGKAVDCKYWPSCGDGETDVDPNDCLRLSYILREADEQERGARKRIFDPAIFDPKARPRRRGAQIWRRKGRSAGSGAKLGWIH